MKVVCQHCALPFSVARVAPGRPVFCCSGCALAARVPVDAQGQFPVNAALLTALGAGFVFFNQLLFWLLAVLLARDEAGAVNAARFAAASLGVGVLVWASLGMIQLREGARRGVDKAVWGLSGLMLGWSVAEALPALAALANALFIAWALRGLARGRPRG